MGSAQLQRPKPNFGGGYEPGERQSIAQRPTPGVTWDPTGLGAVELFDKTMTDLNRVRGNDYGHPYVNFGRIAQIEAVWSKTARTHACGMCCGRLLSRCPGWLKAPATSTAGTTSPDTPAPRAW